MDNVFGALGVFFSSSIKIAKAHGYQKNLSHSFIKRFQKKTLEGILGPTPPPPTKSLPYKIFT